MNAQTVSFENLQVGKWYCIGFENQNGEIEWGGAALYQWNGDCWLDDEGEPRILFDCNLQLNVADDAADAYLPQ